MLRRVFCLVLIFVILSISLLSMAAIAPNITINLNGNTLTFDAKPRNVNGRILVPVAALAKDLGGQAQWIPITKTVTIVLPTEPKKTINIRIGQKAALVNGMEIDLDTASVIYEDRAFVPLRFISENFGAKVKWNSKTKTVNITYTVPVQEEPPILIPPWELQNQTTGSAIKTNGE